MRQALGNLPTCRERRAAPQPGSRPSAPEGDNFAAREVTGWLDSVYDRLRTDIISGSVSPGTHLVEVALAAQYNTSRTPIREALLQLLQDRLIARTPGGMVVRERDPEEIIGIYETWIPLEAVAAASAARRRTLLDVARMRGASSAMERGQPSNGPSAVEMNRAYHGAIWVASHNDTMIDVLSRLEAQICRLWGSTLLDPGRWETALAEHKQITHAIERQDAAAAEELARAHLQHALELRLDALVQQVTPPTSSRRS